MAIEDKSLIASSEFDPAQFVKGIDAMTAALAKLSAEEDKLRADMAQVNQALKQNRTEYKATEDQIKALDQSSKTYTQDLAKLQTQQATLATQNKALRETYTQQKTALGDINKSANDYRNAIQGIAAVSRQVQQENKGRTLFDVASLNQQVQEVTQLGGQLRNVFQGKISTAELDKFEQELSQTNDEMQQLGQIITFVKGKLDTLDPNSQEFADLTRVVQVGEQVLEEFNKTVDQTEKRGTSLRGRLAALRAELVALEDQGKENTAEFQKLQIEAGKLQDSISDAQARIKVLSSDTRNLDFGIGAIRGVASAFSVAEGTAALFGIRNEDVMQSIQRLNSLLLILNGLQEIQNLLQKQSVVNIVGQEIATKAAAVATRIYTVAVGTSTGALKAFRVALLTTGIGAFVVLLGLAADAMGLFGSTTADATKETNFFNDALDESVAALELRRGFMQTDGEVAEEQAKRAGKSESELSELRIKNMEKERQAIQLALKQIRNDQQDFLNAGLSGDFIEKANQQALQLFTQIMGIDDKIRLEKEKNLTRTVDDNKRAAEKQLALYRSYLDRLTALQRELRDKTLAAQPQDEARIREGFSNSIADALADLDKDVKEGKLTKQRAGVLASLLKQINTVDLDKGIKDFQKAAADAEEDFSRTLFDLRIENGRQRAELIRDQFTQEADTVRIEARNNATLLKRERDDLIKSINETRDAGLISPEAAQTNIERVQDIYAQLLENLAAQTTRKQEEISARMFESTQNDLQRIFSAVQLTVSEAATNEILSVTEKFTSGAIKYAEYQKELTRIAKEETDRRIATAIREQEALLAGVQARIKTEKDPQRKKDLEDQERAIRGNLSDLRRQEAAGDVDEKVADDNLIAQRIKQVADYATAINGVVQQVVSFWQAANEAEEQQLERSIALQERRVAAAVRIAERGNSEYLRLEEDRLNELTLKQENAARRQIAINAVLQTSQALTAFITALSQGIATAGPLGGVAIATAVIGLIASGYAIISSLQSQNRQTFFKGTKKVERKNGEPDGVDTVPAMLTAGEAVIPKDTNEEYKPAIDAIFDKKIPAEVMNTFVNNYRVNNRVLPRLDHERMGEVANVVVTYDGQLLEATRQQTKKLEENIEATKRMEKRLAAMGVSVNLDKNGLAIALMKTVHQHNIDKKS